MTAAEHHKKIYDDQKALGENTGVVDFCSRFFFRSSGFINYGHFWKQGDRTFSLTFFHWIKMGVKL